MEYSNTMPMNSLSRRHDTSAPPLPPPNGFNGNQNIFSDNKKR